MIVGTQHFIVPRQMVWMVLFVVGGIFLGLFTAEHLRGQHVVSRLKEKNEGVKGTNDRLKMEKVEYKALFGDMNDHLEEWKKGQDLTFEHQQERIESFQGQAEALIQGLEDVRTVLEEKEFQLWEKEGLLEYQEERLMDSEDLELEMASFINQLAEKLLSLNKTLPEGLDRRPYYGHDFMLGDDEGDMVDDAPRRFLSDEQRRQNGGGGRIAELAAMQRQVERRALQARLPHATSLAHEVRKTLVAALSANGASRSAVKRTARPSAAAARAVRRARRTMS